MRITLTLTALLLATAAHARDTGAPPTRIDPVTDTYADGTKVTDPYRWLENSDDPAVHAWSVAQDARTRAFLDKLPMRAPIHQRLAKLIGAASPSYHDLIAAGGKLFATVVQPPKQQPFIGVMGLDADPAHTRAIVDPNVLNPSGTTAIDWWVPSPDGTKLAVSLSQNGSEDGTLHVFDVASGRELETPIPHVQYPTGGGSVAWRADSSGLFYTRYPGTERPAADQHFSRQISFSCAGAPQSQDHYVMGRDFPKLAEIALSSRQTASMSWSRWRMVTADNLPTM